MDITTKLDLDVVALETTDTVTVMLDLTAPANAEVPGRPSACVVAVLDRSGSMAGGRLAAAKQGLLSVLDRMPDGDRLGVVVFGSQASLALPAEPLTPEHRVRARAAIGRIETSGNTDLGAGLLRGLQEARRGITETGATIVVLSDGQANTGITEPGQLAGLTVAARADNITTSTIGIGLGYDEQLLEAIAHGGAGNASFAEHADGASAAIGAEVDGLMSKTVQAVTATLRPTDAVTLVSVLSEVPSTALADGINIDLGDMYASESRRLLLQITVPGRSALGLMTIAELELRYVSLPEVVEHTVRLPISINVVPGDEAAGRVASPEVTKERLLLEVQRTKRLSEEQIRSGDVEAARVSLKEAMTLLHAAPMIASDADLQEEREWVERTTENLDSWSLDYTAKRLNTDRMKKGSGRRSRTQGGEIVPDDQD